MDYFEADVTRSQMFTSEVIKARNVHVERYLRDFLYAQWENVNVMVE